MKENKNMMEAYLTELDKMELAEIDGGNITCSIEIFNKLRDIVVDVLGVWKED